MPLQMMDEKQDPLMQRKKTDERIDKHRETETDEALQHNYSVNSRTGLTSRQVLENVFPEEQPERPLQFISGNQSSDEGRTLQASEEKQMQFGQQNQSESD